MKTLFLLINKGGKVNSVEREFFNLKKMGLLDLSDSGIKTFVAQTKPTYEGVYGRLHDLKNNGHLDLSNSNIEIISRKFPQPNKYAKGGGVDDRPLNHFAYIVVEGDDADIIANTDIGGDMLDVLVSHQTDPNTYHVILRSWANRYEGKLDEDELFNDVNGVLYDSVYDVRLEELKLKGKAYAKGGGVDYSNPIYQYDIRKAKENSKLKNEPFVVVYNPSNDDTEYMSESFWNKTKKTQPKGTRIVFSTNEEFAKGGGVDKFQTRYLLSNYGYRGDKGTEIEVVDIQGDIVFGNPKKIKLSKFQKEMLPYEYEIDDTSVLPIKAKGGECR